MRYLDPNWRERSQSFPTSSRVPLRRSRMRWRPTRTTARSLTRPPDAVTFRRFAETWLAAQMFAESTQESVAGRLIRTFTRTLVTPSCTRWTRP